MCQCDQFLGRVRDINFFFLFFKMKNKKHKNWATQRRIDTDKRLSLGQQPQGATLGKPAKTILFLHLLKLFLVFALSLFLFPDENYYFQFILKLLRIPYYHKGARFEISLGKCSKNATKTNNNINKKHKRERKKQESHGACSTQSSWHSDRRESRTDATALAEKQQNGKYERNDSYPI